MKMKPSTNSIEIHPYMNNYMHPMDGVLVGASLMWPLNC